MKTKEAHRIVQISPDLRTIILGKYNGIQCGGCDTIESGAAVKELLAWAIRFGAETIIFEGILYSASLTFCKDIQRLAKAAGFEYIIVWVNRNVDKCLNAIYERNGGKRFNVKGIVDRARAVERVAKAMESHDARVVQFDPDNDGDPYTTVKRRCSEE